MPTNTLLESAQDVYPVGRGHLHTDALAVTILDHLNEQTVISLDSLICLMPHYTWNQIFHTVDQLARCHEIVLRKHRFEYMLFSIHYRA
ncbi:MAG: hypothetical protein ABI988_17095 [Nitrospirota bacterium]